jgi:hypothetical protein
MGACNFIEFQEAANAQVAFQLLVSDAVFDYGHDPYNGTISTTRLNTRRKPVVVRKRFTEKAIDAAYEVAEKDKWGEKWEARVIDCGLVPHKKGVHMWAFYGWAAC